MGMLDWKLGHIIESLPLILHGSVAIFLIGLSLYVSQRSHPISWVVASITIITFAAYLGTSILPAISIACPYRIPSIFPLAQAVKFALRITRYWFFKIFLRSDLARHPEWPVMSNDSLQTAEQNAVFRNQSDSYGPLDKVTWQLTCDILYWMFDHSSNQSVKEVVAEAVSGLLGEWKEFLAPTSPQGSSGISDTRKLLAHGIFPPAILIFLAKIVDMPPRPESFTEDTLRHDIWGRAIDILAKVSDSSDLVSMYGDHNKQLKNQIYDSIKQAYLAASRKGEHILAERLLHLGGPEMLKAAEEFLGKTLLHEVACEGTKEAILSLLKLYGNEIIQELDNEGWSAFHHAAENGKLDAIKTLVDAEPSIIPLKCHSGETALDIALRFGECQVARYLLDKGAEESPFALHAAVPHKNACDLVRILLEKGSNTDTGREEFGKTAMDIANELPPSDQRDSIIALLNEGTNVTLISKQSGGT
ncbi:hypothetical protein H0H87_002768 [Tephrocybe sp. NHM501043]|nr:hypothetical protein H0H87_002768 [Tephrocybe sp. NHM501043]